MTKLTDLLPLASGGLFDLSVTGEILFADESRALSFIARHQLQAGEDREKARARVRGTALAAVGATDFRRGYGVTAAGAAVIPIIGSLGPARYWCWTSYEEIREAHAAALADPDVKGIVRLVDSPGGYVTGCQELAIALEEMHASAGKPVHTFANDLMASAAFWIGVSGTDHVAATAVADVGSVGALCLHIEISKALEDFGVRPTIVRSRERKAEHNFLEPLSEKGHAQLQAQINNAAAIFERAVAEARGISLDVVAATEAACLTAPQALEIGFIDSIETTAGVLAVVVEPSEAAEPAPQAQASPAAPVKPVSTAASGGKPKGVPARNQESSAVNDTEKAARRDRIAEALAGDAEDEAAKAAQYDQAAAICDEPDPDETSDDDAPASDASAAVSAERKRVADILALPEAKANAEVAQLCIAKGLSVGDARDMLKASGAKAPTSTAAGALAAARSEAASAPIGDGGGSTEGEGDAVAFVLGAHAAATGKKPKAA